ncbi:MAG: hypothetical protein HC905_25120 [Bacteroidales bacterium]|nr:hypothetical protein [Bacteroidales bacterium]
MKKSLLFICLLFSIAAAAQDAAQLIGTWRATYVTGEGLFRTPKTIYVFLFTPTVECIALRTANNSMAPGKLMVD